MDCFQNTWNLKFRYSCVCSSDHNFYFPFCLFCFVGPLSHSNQAEPCISTLTGVNCTISPRSLPPVLLIVSYFLSSFKWHRFEPYLCSIKPVYRLFIVPKRAIWVWNGKLHAPCCPSCNFCRMFSAVVFCYSCGPCHIHVAIAIFWKGATRLHELELVCVISP